MALDALKETDEVVTDQNTGVIVIANKNLLVETGTITVDFTGLGFSLKSENALSTDKASGGCAGCGSGCSDDKKEE